MAPLPYRGTFGDPRPPQLTALALPPAPMPSGIGTRPLKAWRYVGVFGPELMLCVASVRVGPSRQSFWAVWDRSAGRLYERTAMGAGAVRLGYGTAVVDDRELGLDLAFTEGAGVETVCASGDGYAWTRKQGGVIAGGTIALGGAPRRAFAGRAVIDDTAAYYERHTRWRWSAGVGTARRRPPGGLEPRRRGQRPTARQRAHGVARRRARRGRAGPLRRGPVSGGRALPRGTCHRWTS